MPPTDPNHRGAGLSTQVRSHRSLPKDGSIFASPPRAVRFGVGGTVTMTLVEGGEETYQNVPDGWEFVGFVKSISAATTADNIIGWD